MFMTVASFFASLVSVRDRSKFGVFGVEMIIDIASILFLCSMPLFNGGSLAPT